MSDAPLPLLIDRSEGDINVSDARQRWREAQSRPVRELLARDEAAFVHQAMSTPCLSALSSAKGSCIVDLDGKSLLDFHGNSVHQIGHGHPRVVEAIVSQLYNLPFCPRRFTNLAAVELAEKLAEISPGRALTKVLLAPGGAEAMSMAMKLARLTTGKTKFVSFTGSFHGATLDTISIGGEAHFRDGVGPLLPGCLHVPAPTPSRCQNNCGPGQGCVGKCLSALQRILESDNDIAAVIGEPIRCTTVDLPPHGYWQAVRSLCDQRGVLLIVDEIPLCLGRTGRWFSIDHEEVVPDILVIGKGLGGGILPMAAMLVRPELDRAHRTSLGHFTHEKSPLGAAAALETIRIIEDEGLLRRSSTLGGRLMDQLRLALSDVPFVHEIRGRGLLVGVQLRSALGQSAEAAAERVMYHCLENGLSFKVSGGNVLTLCPPLVIADHELDHAVEILAEAFRTLVSESSIGSAAVAP
ncbi:MAG: aspartate aminotransferase family protein [Phycisphaerales bacterium]|nr:aspartate aminotransferase family protein [Phycisphaerales bacterium]